MNKNNFQKGQSLIETIAAIFILTMALTTVIGVTIYALSKSNVSQKEIVATNLAREGIDVLRMMRDTNWMAGDVGGANYSLDVDCGTTPPNGNTGLPQTGQGGASENPMNNKTCYPQWMDGPTYNFDPNSWSGANDARVRLDTPSSVSWILETVNGSRRYHMCIEATGEIRHSNACDNNTNPPYARRIQISSANTASPYTRRNPQLRVVSTVVWQDKKCPSIVNADPVSLNTSCKVVTEEFLTNWKDYQ